MKKCGALYFDGFSERKCNKVAIALFDADKPGGFPVCAECAKLCHPSRLMPIEQAALARQEAQP